jgi:hypothetical protein
MRREAQSRGDQGTDHRRVTMNDADYMKRKDEINRQLQVSQEKLDNIVVQYVEVISRVLSEWAKETVEDAVMDKAEITKSLPEKELREMKAQMNALMDELPAWVSEEFDKDEKWPHRMDIPKDLHRDRMEIQLAIERRRARADEAIRRLLGRVGSLLREYGFVEERRRIWDFNLDGTAVYRYNLPRSKEAEILMEAYFDSLREYGELANRLRELEHTKKAKEAKSRWDSI